MINIFKLNFMPSGACLALCAFLLLSVDIKQITLIGTVFFIQSGGVRASIESHFLVGTMQVT